MALELARYNIDIAALSETRLHGEDSLSEVGAGYTFFWKRVPEGTRRKHGVGFDVKSKLLQRIPESPVKHLVWSKVIGQHGVGKMNHNGLRLLSLCAEHQLVITNTIFQMKNRLKTTWQHPPSKHWHLLDYVILRQGQKRCPHHTFHARS